MNKLIFSLFMLCLAAQFSAAQRIERPVVGKDKTGQGGNKAAGNKKSASPGPQVNLPSLPRISNLALGFQHSLAVDEQGYLWSWGQGYNGSLGNGSRMNLEHPRKVNAQADWKQVFSTGNSFSIALKKDGSLWTWGENDNGQLGDGSFTTKARPVQVGSDQDWVMVWSARNSVYALKANGSLWAWGDNEHGRLGINTNQPAVCRPHKVNDGPWKQVFIGSSFVVALRTNGTLWSWGQNSQGQLGDGTTKQRNAPVQIGGKTDWRAVGVGSAHTLALDAGGKLWSWGINLSGACGDGTTAARFRPVAVMPEKRWQAVSASGYYSLALDQEGSLWSWGDNNRQQLGDGTEEERHRPVRVTGPQNWTGVQALDETVFAFKADGSMWSWGSSQYAFLGTGEGFYTDRGIPKPIPGKGWDQVELNYSSVLARKTDGTVWAWGNNEEADLGIGKAAGERVGRPVAVKYAFPESYAPKRKNDLADKFGEDGLSLFSQDGKLGVINRKREQLIPPVYDDLESDAVYYWASRDQKWGLIDRRNRTVIPFLYDDVFHFRQGLARVRKNDKYGYINEDGEVVIDIKYEAGWIVDDDGTVSVRYNGKWGLVNDTGQVVVPFLYDSALNFFQGKAKVLVNGETFSINKKGEKVN